MFFPLAFAVSGFSKTFITAFKMQLKRKRCLANKDEKERKHLRYELLIHDIRRKQKFDTRSHFVPVFAECVNRYNAKEQAKQTEKKHITQSRNAQWNLPQSTIARAPETNSVIILQVSTCFTILVINGSRPQNSDKKFHKTYEKCECIKQTSL
jgi:hypothetical protein